ncbi:hypothetical protein FIV00_14240 [Labrenzia sp. THAF82]|nr:hypothetical protein FIV00_14240 [Labrenzia sp. THAF82]
MAGRFSGFSPIRLSGTVFALDRLVFLNHFPAWKVNKGLMGVLLDLLLVGYIASAGFVAAGVLGSLYQLVTKEPPKFNFGGEGFLSFLTGITLCVFAGPFIIMRNAIRGRRIEKRPLGWLVASSTIAGMWSVCSGVMVMNVALIVAGF